MIDCIHGDCLEKMKDIPDGSVDMVLTSPPYDNLRSYNGNNKLWNKTVWKNIIKELYRVVNDGGVVVWVVGDKTINGNETGTSFEQALYFKSVGFNLNDTMIFEKQNPLPTDKRYRYCDCFEYMFVFSKNRNKTFNPLLEKTTTKRTYKSSWGRKNDKLISSVGKTRTTKDFKVKKNIFSYAISKGGATKNNNAFKHPAIFPEKLASDHIISWSNEGDTILDPFMGSGTTGVACVNLNRSFIGIEQDENYYNLGVNRINEHIKNPESKKVKVKKINKKEDPISIDPFEIFFK